MNLKSGLGRHVNSCETITVGYENVGQAVGQQIDGPTLLQNNKWVEGLRRMS